MAEEWRYSHPKEWYKEIGEHSGDSKWQTCGCRSCQDKRQSLVLSNSVGKSE